MVNKAVQQLICKDYGEDTWQRIRAKAGVDVEVFMSNESYPDEVTYRLVAAASEELNLPAADILRAFGEHWVLHTALDGYGGLMRAGGNSLPEFLENLPNFHTRVAMIFPKLEPPRFACSDVTPHSLHLHYHTHRPGLEPFVEGLLTGLGKMFNVPVRVELLESRGCGADHDVFALSWHAA